MVSLKKKKKKKFKNVNILVKLFLKPNLNLTRFESNFFKSLEEEK